MPDEEKPPIAGVGPRLATKCPPEADSLGHGVAENDCKIGAPGEEPTEPETQPTVEPPTGDGWMPLGKVALWIATEGGTVAATSGDQERWEAAFRKLTNALSFGKLRCTGERNGRGEDIPTENWAHCRVDFMGAAWVDDNFRDGLYLADKFHLRTYAVVDVDAWPNGVGDALLNRQDGWTNLIVPEEAVLDRWPFEAGTPEPDATRPAAGQHSASYDNLRRRSGAKPTYDWTDIRLKVFELLRDRGDFEDDGAVKGWNSLNCLIGAIQEYVGRPPGSNERAPSESRLKSRLPAMVQEWRNDNRCADHARVTNRK